MKKILIFVLLLAGLAAAGVYFTRTSSTPTVADYYAAYLPENTLATVSLLDLKGLSESFPSSSLGQFVSKQSMHAVFTELGAPDDALHEYDQVFDGIADVMTNPAFRQVFGDDAVIAVLAPDVVQLQKEPEKELQKSLMVFGTSSVTGALDSFAKLVMSQNVSTKTVAGLEVTRIQIDNDNVLYGYADGNVLVLAYDPTRIATAVKRRQQGDGLLSSPQFAAVQSFWKTTSRGREYARIFLNSPAFRDLLNQSNKDEAREFAGMLSGFKAMGSALFDTNGDLHSEARIDYDQQALNPLVKKQFHAVSSDNLSLGQLTSGTLAYYWTSILDKAYLQGLFAKADEPRLPQIQAKVERQLGVTLDEVMSAFGPQVGLTLDAIVNTGLFPLPRIIAFVQVREKSIARKVIDTLRKDITDKGITTEQHEVVNGHTVYYWSVLPGEATQVALVMTDTMLYVANGKSTLARLVDKDAHPNVLPQAMATLAGKELVQRIKGSNYATYVMRPDRFATEIKDGADWLADMISASQGTSVNKLKDALLQLMHATDMVVATTHIGKDFTTSSMVFTAAKAKKEKQ